MKIRETVRNDAEEQGVTDDQALDKGMAERSGEFFRTGNDLYAKA